MWHTVWSSLPELISAGLKYTIPLAVISFALGLVLALITALIRISQTKGVFPDGIKLEPFTAGIIVFTLNTGAYASETIRAAIESIPKGQWEAAQAIGMTRFQTLFRIIIPQAARVSLPPLTINL